MTTRFAWLALLCASLFGAGTGCRMCANCDDYCLPVLEAGPERCNFNYRKNSAFWDGGYYESMPGEVLEPQPEPITTPIPQPGSVRRYRSGGPYVR